MDDLQFSFIEKKMFNFLLLQ